MLTEEEIDSLVLLSAPSDLKNYCKYNSGFK